MRRLLPLVLLLAVGCQQTGQPTTQPSGPSVEDVYINANQTFAATVSLLTDLRNAGVFTPQHWTNDVLPAINGANAALTAWGQHLHDSAEVQAESAFLASLPNLLAYVPHQKPTTNPL